MGEAMHLRVSYYGKPDTGCGRRSAVNVTQDPGEVTCKRCKASRAYQYRQADKLRTDSATNKENG